MPILVQILVVVAGACLFGVLTSALMSWASNRPALWNMVFGGFLALAVLAGALLIAFVLTRATYP